MISDYWEISSLSYRNFLLLGGIWERWWCPAYHSDHVLFLVKNSDNKNSQFFPLTELTLIIRFCKLIDSYIVIIAILRYGCSAFA